MLAQSDSSTLPTQLTKIKSHEHVSVNNINAIEKVDDNLKVFKSARNWTPLLYIRLMQNYSLERDVAVHLANSYGDMAFQVASLATVSGKRWSIVGRRLHPDLPYLEAEVKFAMQQGFACSVIDFFKDSQTSLAKLENAEKLKVLPKIVRVIAKELGWSEKRQEIELKKAKMYLMHSND